MNICSKCNKNIISSEYIVYKHKKVCIFCMNYQEFNKLNIIKYKLQNKYRIVLI